IKLDSSDRRLRLNASVFYYDYRDVQGFVNARTGMDGDNGELVLERLRSLGDATHSGVETAVVWVLSQWELRVAAGYLDARIDHAAGKTFNAAGEEVSTKGRRGYAPRWNGSVAATHFRPLTSASMLQMTVSANYRSDLSPRLTSPVDEAVGHLPGYWLVNADVAVVAADDTWRLSVWVENLANKTYSPRKAYD